MRIPTNLLRLGPSFASHRAAAMFSSTSLRAFPNPFASQKELVAKVLKDPKWPSEWPYSDEDFKRQDESPDELFYDWPRFVHHIDDGARTALTEYYAENLKLEDDVLDICSSWVSHYPEEWAEQRTGNVVGLGMNEEELAKNPQLNSYVKQDLNENPTLPFETDSFDVITCVVSIDYLNKPRDIFSEMSRVLRPGGRVLLSMSNRCFPTKAFQIWLRVDELTRLFIVGSFFHFAGSYEPPEAIDISPAPGRSDPMYIVKATNKR